MAPPTDRQQYRELVAQVAEKAKARLPQAVNGRIEGAVKLVLMGDVMPQDDGSIQVGSCTDPTKVYTLSGQACTCKDFTDGKAPEGWCRHRIAAGIAKRVGELLPQPAAAEKITPQDPVTPLPEAPASVNCHLVIMGRQVQLTLRDSDESQLLARLEAVLQRFPLPDPPSSGSGQDKGWCHKHNLPMKLNHSKDGRMWYSHKTDQGWCKGVRFVHPKLAV
jgi:hypothetical protein